MNDFAKPLRKLLLQAGCSFVRDGKGSHESWYSPVSNKTFTVATSITSRHTENGILKQAGLPKAF